MKIYFTGIDLTGSKFTRLTALELVEKTFGPNGTRLYWWKCKCDCGDIKIVRGDSLRRGGVKSCGCLGPEVTSKRSLLHGESGENRTKMYSIWLSMMARCRRKPGYVSRGITVCHRWATYENFKSDMEASYSDGLTIERINNDGNYEPGNCRWATAKEQQNNKTNTVRIQYGGETKTLQQWSDKVGLSGACIKARIKMQWPIGDVLFKPKEIHQRRIRV